MTIGQSLAAEIEAELPATVAHLENVPEDKFDFRPHDKSFSMLQLASHIPETYTWIDAMLDHDELDFDPSTYTPWVAGSKTEAIEALRRNAADAAEKLRTVSDEAMATTWTMRINGQAVMQCPRMAVVRMMMLSHTIHHRAQLGVYLRLCDVPVPPTYGPSADDQG
jgi:uncharacterized damage-inducible protein DinB